MKQDQSTHRALRAGVLACAMFAVAVAGVNAAKPTSPPTPSPKPQGAEVQFVAQIQRDLRSRFPTPQDAMRAGYFRYTLEDDTGSISYANLQWTSADPSHPSQLWYDVHGNLLGADYSVPYTTARPKLWGIDPRRWMEFEAHMHWVLNVNGKPTFGETSVRKFRKAGGDPKDPQAATVVKLGKATSAAQVTHVFLFPDIWDLVVWVKDNPSGAFSWTNPLVKPSKNAKTGSM